MSRKNPVKFSDLTEAELAAAADYFGVEVGTKDFMVAGFVDDNIEWNDYVAADVPGKPESLVVAPVEPEVVETAAPAGVVTADVVNPVEPKEETVTAVVTAERQPVLPQADYLIKMERKNPLFEFGPYRFTQENPYNIMPAADAQKILTKEDGFRQAFPEELREYYS